MTRILAWLRRWWRHHIIDDCPQDCPDCAKEASK